MIEDRVQALLDGLFEVEGIESSQAQLESAFGLWGDVSGIHVAPITPR
jgi:hypothetical protein